MKVLLLVAGKSERFWPLEHKSLFRVAGKMLVEWQIERLKEAGCEDITIVAGPHNIQQTKKVLPGFEVLEQEDMTLGTRGALLSALPKIGDGPVMVVAGTDIVEASAYKSILDAAAKPGVDGAILGKEMETYFPGGYMTVKEDQVIDIVEKPGEGNEPSKLVNIVIHVHNDRDALWSALQSIPDLAGDGYSQTEQILFRTKHYKAVPYAGDWQYVKYPWHILNVMKEFMKTVTETKIHPTAKIHPSAVIEGPVHIEEGVEVQPLAVIIGPTTIGKHAEIGPHAVIRKASIGEGCKIGGRSEIKESVIAGFTKTHGCYVGDSVLGESINIATGCVIGNLRFDEREVQSQVGEKKIGTGRRKCGAFIGSDTRLGLQVGTSPGIKIGRGTFINSACMVTQDIPDKNFVTTKDGVLHMRPNLAEAPDFRKHS